VAILMGQIGTYSNKAEDTLYQFSTDSYSVENGQAHITWQQSEQGMFPGERLMRYNTLFIAFMYFIQASLTANSTMSGPQATTALIYHHPAKSNR
jgi:hypothetical protein